MPIDAKRPPKTDNLPEPTVGMGAIECAESLSNATLVVGVAGAGKNNGQAAANLDTRPTAPDI